MRVREEAGRETEEMENTGRGKNRIKITVSKDKKKKKKDFTHTQCHGVYMSYPFTKLCMDHWCLTACFMTCLCRVRHRYSSKVQASSLGKAFSQSSGSGQSHNTQGRKLSMCRGFPNQHKSRT